MERKSHNTKPRKQRKPDERHGMSYSAEYRTWDNMLARCYRPSNPYYPLYGAKGIRVAQEWRDSFAAFFAHIGPRPSGQHSIDRIDPSRNYEPGNVRWATPQQQNANLRRRKDNRSGYKGVSWSRADRKWRVTVCLDGKQFHVGLFTDRHEAANGYDQFALQLFGSFARTNFVYE